MIGKNTRIRLVRISLALVALALCELRAQQIPSTPPPAADVGMPANYVNEDLPAWMRLGGEFRTRVEGRTAFSFKEGNDDAYALTRLRLSLDLLPESWFHAFIQGQDSRPIAIDPARATTSMMDYLDLRQAYVEFNSGGERRVRVTVGRQELLFGAGRLISPSDWGNVTRTFDAVRLTIVGDGSRVDIFAASVVSVRMRQFDKPLTPNNLYGVYGTFTKVVPKSTFEPYFLWKAVQRVTGEEKVAGDADIYTGGVRWVGLLPAGFDYAAEGGRQAGHYATDNVHAWAGYVIGRFLPSGMPLTPRFSAEYAYASGDQRARDGRVGTFDQLYPSSHGLRGITDQFGWRNIRNLRAGVEFKPYRKLRINLDFHSFWLASKYDGIYNTSGSLIVKAPASGAAHGDVGKETDVYVTDNYSERITLGAGCGHLFPGRFLKENSPGSSMSYPYGFVSYEF
jgi:Alginate export